MNTRWERVYKPNQTSARLMAEYAEQKFGATATGAADPRMLLTWDLFIKARVYAMANKAAFVGSLILGPLVLTWPGIATVVEHSEGASKALLAFFTSPVIQTTVTALAAACFAFYTHYKEQQLRTENLMRVVVLSEDPAEEKLASVIREMQRIDVGFAFSEHILRRHDKPEAPPEGEEPPDPEPPAPPEGEAAPERPAG